jgi:hypothetical protein
MDAKNTAIFAAILECRSMTVIQHTVEDTLSKPIDSEDRDLFEQIQKLNSLDQIWIICHHRLANWHLYTASQIRQFLIRKAKQ